MDLAGAGELLPGFGQLSQFLDQVPKALENPAQPQFEAAFDAFLIVFLDHVVVLLRSEFRTPSLSNEGSCSPPGEGARPWPCFRPFVRRAWTIAVRSTWTVLLRTISRSDRSLRPAGRVQMHAPPGRLPPPCLHALGPNPRCSSVTTSSAMQNGAADDRPKLAHIARPAVGQHRLDRRRGKTLDGLGKLDVGNIHEPLRQVRYVLPALAQRRDERWCIRSTGSKGRDGTSRYRKVASRSWPLAVSIRTSTWIGLTPPSRYRVFSWSTRSSLA